MFFSPTGLAIDAHDDLFVAPQGTVYEVKPDGTTSTIDLVNLFPGIFFAPTGVAVDCHGDLFVGDEGSIFEVMPGSDHLLSDGTIRTVADGVSNIVVGLALDANGDLFSIGSPGSNNVSETLPGPDGLLSDGSVTNPAGNGAAGYSAEGGAANAAELYAPSGMAVDAQSNLFIADTNNNVVERVALNATVTVLPVAPPTAPATVVKISASSGAAIAWNSGQDITFTATVAPEAAGCSTPAGTVRFVVDGVPMDESLTLDSTGTASITLNPVSLGLGNHAVSAIYSSNSRQLRRQHRYASRWRDDL